MKQLLLIASLLCFYVTSTFSQSTYSRIKVRFTTEKTAFQLARLGIDISHGSYAPGKHYIGELSDKEVQLIQAAGFTTEILIPDLTAHFLNAAQAGTTVASRNQDCDGGGSSNPYDNYETPENYELGSMGGYLTYEEMLDNLDNMAAMYPHLITTRAPVDDILTHEERPIYWIKVSDNPNTDETTEPEVLYTAVHHAREANSLAQMIFYLWYLLENYENDAEVKYLVDNVEMYFMPCINPDGYIFNQENEPNGGGFWRKNRRDNGDGTKGVDLNRNYGYEWGVNDIGSSPNPDSEVYRGPAPFSEPETQAVKAFSEAHEFEIALNYHTYGNLLVHPWGYDDMPTEEDELFKAMAMEMTTQNNFTYGTGLETVGYNVNGDSDDWLYGEQTTKPKIYSMTPEVGPGNLGFWPTPSDIIPLNKSCMYMNLAVPHLTLNFGVATDMSEQLVTEYSNEMEVDVQKIGLKAGEITVSLLPVSDNILTVSAPQMFDLTNLETVQTSFDYELSNEIQASDEIVFVLAVDNGEFVKQDTLRKTFFTGNVAFLDNADTFDNWQTEDSWAVTTADFFSAPSSITDSPNENYGNNQTNIIETNTNILLENAMDAIVRFRCKWDIENDYDWAQLQVSANGGEYIPLCGEYTNTGVSDQGAASDQPVYDGTQTDWVLEQIDLTEFLSENGATELSFRFVLTSDFFVTGDGYYFDDFEILFTTHVGIETIALDNQSFEYALYPNPTAATATIEINHAIEGYLNVYNSLGKRVLRQPIAGTKSSFPVFDLPNGCYHYQLEAGGKLLPAKSFTILR